MNYRFKQGGTMKPTEQKTILDFLNEVSIEKGYRNWYDVYSHEHYSECNRIPQEAGRRYAQWAISQMQPEWVSASPMTVETAAKLADTDLNLILCRFDNGQILRYNEDHPFAVLTDLLFIPQPPTK